MSKKLPCYLRTHRRRFALSQKELAHLFGLKGVHAISRLENDKRKPTLFLLLGSEILFGVHAKDMYPKLFDEVEESVVRGLYQLEERLEASTTLRSQRKRQLIKEAFNRAILRAQSQEQV